MKNNLVEQNRVDVEVKIDSEIVASVSERRFPVNFDRKIHEVCSKEMVSKMSKDCLCEINFDR